jgi:hypothetical protein
MRFHVPSFMLGFATGVAAVKLYPRLRPLLTEIAAVGYRVADSLRARVARAREDLEDRAAAARAVARGHRPDGAAPSASSAGPS